MLIAPRFFHLKKRRATDQLPLFQFGQNTQEKLQHLANLAMWNCFLQVFPFPAPVPLGHQRPCTGDFSPGSPEMWLVAASRLQESRVREVHNIPGCACEAVEGGKRVRKSDKSSEKVHFEFLGRFTS